MLFLAFEYWETSFSVLYMRAVVFVEQIPQAEANSYIP
jgi:hypothetical protein